MTLIDQAITLHQRGNLAGAETIYKQILNADPNDFDALHMLGIVYAARGAFEDAEKLLHKALSVDSKVAPCLHNYGTVLAKLQRFEDAVASYNSAIKLAPSHAPIYSDRGNALFQINHYGEALDSYDRALVLRDNFFDAWNGRGNALFKLKRYDEALGAYDKALALKPDLANAWLGRGNVFNHLKRYDEAIANYDKAIALKPDLAGAWFGRGNVFNQRKRYDEAFANYDKALSLNPGLASAEGDRLYAKMHLCDWSHFEDECEHLVKSVTNGNASASPFTFLAISSLPKDQLQCARQWVTNNIPLSDKAIWQGERYNHDRIRVAYLSADFHQHATSILIAGMFECHDKAQFETIAISFGPNDASEMRRRLEGSFDKFIDVGALTDDEIASQIKEL